jgi:hypothetical protein
MSALCRMYFILVLAGCGGRSLPLAPDGAAAPQVDGSSPESDGVVAMDQGGTGDLVVIVVTDKTAYTAPEPVKATVTGKGVKSFFVAGCSAFNWERLEAGVWKGHGSMVDCFWQGDAVEVPPHAAHTETLYAMGGTWRLVVPYGVGCASSQPLQAESCAKMGTAVSAPFTVTPTAAACQAISNQYSSELTQAQVCNPALSVPQCTTKIESGIICSCPVFVQDATTLLELLAQWTYTRCDTLTWPMCGLKCANPGKAVCTATSGGTGSCAPVF